MTYLYKWMLPGLITPAQNKKWPVKVGEWTPEETPVLCESGWHAVQEKDVLTHLPSQIGAELWIVSVKGQRVNGDNKFCAEQMRLDQLVGTTTDQNLRLFACDVAEDALSLIENPDPGSLKAIEVYRRYANGEATAKELDAAYAAAAYCADASADAAYCAYVAASAAFIAEYAAYAAYAAANAAARAYAATTYASAARGAGAKKRYSNWLVVRLWEGR